MGNFFIKILNFIIAGIGGAIGWVVNLLPNSPFTSIDNSSVGEYLSSLSWIIPFSQIIAIGEAWLTVIIAYYIYSVIMRWIKVIT
jgi:hypothetical protein